MRLAILLILGMTAALCRADPATDMWRSPMWNDALSSDMWNTDTSSINPPGFNAGFKHGYQHGAEQDRFPGQATGTTATDRTTAEHPFRAEG